MTPGFEGKGVFLCLLRTRTWELARAQVASREHPMPKVRPSPCRLGSQGMGWPHSRAG